MMRGQPPLTNTPFLNMFFLKGIAWLFCFSVFLLPPIKLVPGSLSVYGTDLLFPVLCVLLVLKLSSIKWRVYKWLLLTTSFFMGCVIWSILWNGRLVKLSDWFEVYKLLKFAVVVIYVALYFDLNTIDRMLKVIFVLLVLFNTCHYFNMFDFNRWIMPHFAPPIHIDTFGLDSHGLPDTKRILGTVGNPNNNAILFLFFVIFFAEKRYAGMNKVFFYGAVFFTIACQSRTGLCALAVTLILTAVYMKQTIRLIIIDTIVYISMYLLLWLGGNVYLNSLGDFDKIRTSFKYGRIYMWKKLLNMWYLKPLFGYAPNKELFYKNNWYSEGEYILMLWRYGIFGMLAYLFWLVTPFFQAWNKLKIKKYSPAAFRILAFSVVFMIAACTNNPTLDFSLIMQFSIFFGLFLGVQTAITKESKHA